MAKRKGKHRLYDYTPGTVFFDHRGDLNLQLEGLNWVTLASVERRLEVGPEWGSK